MCKKENKIGAERKKKRTKRDCQDSELLPDLYAGGIDLLAADWHESILRQSGLIPRKITLEGAWWKEAFLPMELYGDDDRIYAAGSGSETTTMSGSKNRKRW